MGVTDPEQISWDIDGVSVPLEWSSCDAVAPGGYNQFRATMAEGRYRRRFTQGSVITGHRPNGKVLWQGVIAAPLKVASGMASLVAEGYNSWLRRADQRLPYQIRDGSAWSLAHEEPFGYNTNERYTPESHRDSIGFVLSKDESFASPSRHAYAIYTNDWPVNRIAFTINKSHDDPDFQFELRGADDLGTLSAITTWTMGTANPDGEKKDYSLAGGDYDTLSLGIYCDSAGAPAQTEKFFLTNLRINCIGYTDDLTTSDIADDVADRIGFRPNITPGAVNALPLDWNGAWDELLDYMAAIEDYVWFCEENDPGRDEPARLTFRPWGHKAWQTTLEMATENLTVAPLYNRVTTYFERPAGVPQSVTAKPSDFGLTDPLPRGVTYEYPDPIVLQDPQHNHNIADAINQRMLARLIKPRLQGSVLVHDLRKGNPFDIRAGDTLEILGFEPDAGPQRVVGVTYNRDGTVSCTLDRSYDVTALLYRMDRMRKR